jgi:hypothetical protein
MADIIIVAAPSHSLRSNALNDLMHECNKNHGHNLPTKFNGLPSFPIFQIHYGIPSNQIKEENIIAKAKKKLTHQAMLYMNDLMHEKTR